MPRRNRRDTARRPREFAREEREPSYEDLARDLVASGKCSASGTPGGRPRVPPA